MGCAMLYRLAGEICDEGAETRFSPDKLGELAGNLSFYVDQPLNNLELAQALEVGKTTSHKRFVKRFGMPPHRWLRKLRLERARELLISTGLPIAAIAEQCGFHNPQYFMTLFRESYGLPPGKFREKHLSESRNASSEERSSSSPR